MLRVTPVLASYGTMSGSKGSWSRRLMSSEKYVRLEMSGVSWGRAAALLSAVVLAGTLAACSGDPGEAPPSAQAKTAASEEVHDTESEDDSPGSDRDSVADGTTSTSLQEAVDLMNSQLAGEGMNSLTLGDVTLLMEVSLDGQVVVMTYTFEDEQSPEQWAANGHSLDEFVASMGDPTLGAFREIDPEAMVRFVFVNPDGTVLYATELGNE